MRVLVLGSGGREHALAWALVRSGGVDEAYAAPGNPGIAEVAQCVDADLADVGGVAALADDLDVDLVVVGPEAPLVAGVADAVEARGRRVFGPRAAAARLEGSKAWCKELLAEAGVPTARHATFGAGRQDEALAHLESVPGPYVVKADGLAAGKGVLVTESLEEARDAVRRYLSGEAFGEAGTTLVIEEGLSGSELTLMVLCDGERAVPLAGARDYKPVLDGNRGPNTGGMGAFSPVLSVDDALVQRVMDEAVEPTLAALRALDIEYRGVLYIGLMLTEDGPKILEYNCRFGDPEAQVVLPRLASDLAVHCLEAAEGKLRSDVAWRQDACVTVAMACEGYPVEPRTGDVIEGLGDAEALDGVIVFHAGTGLDGGRVVTAGGRVLNVTALGDSVAQARRRAYEAVERITWPGAHYRTDIAQGAT